MMDSGFQALNSGFPRVWILYSKTFESGFPGFTVLDSGSPYMERLVIN